MIDLQKELNDEQRAVVESGNGPCLVLAGAGSGKTRTITYRVAQLLEQGVDPREILLVTFTNKAAAEMKARVAQITGKPNQLPWSGTFHHIGYRLLRMHAPLIGFKNNFTVLDSDDSQSLIKLCAKEAKPDAGETKFPSASVLQNIISYCRNSELPLTHVVEEKYTTWIRVLESVHEVASLYELKKKEANAMDFDDLLTKTKQLLQQPEVLKKYATQFKYVLVDEYQDTNTVQASIVKMLASVHKNILVVGDDAQSIYSFRAANIENILGFEREFQGARVFRLETNYRSSPAILSLANNVIANNVHQYQKKLRSAKQGDGLPILQPQVDQQNEGSYIAHEIEKLLEHNVPADEIAVLFRAAAHSQMLEVELVQRGIAYDYRGGVRFFERAHVKDALAYLRIVSNLADTAAWLRILMHEEGIGPAAAEKVIKAIQTRTVILSETKNPLKSDKRDPSARSPEATKPQDDDLQHVGEIGEQVLGAKAQIGWSNFLQIWNALLDEPTRAPANLIKALLKTRYVEYLESEYIDSKDRMLDLKQLAVFAERYDDLDTFVAEATLQESFRQLSAGGEEKESDKKIILSTIHQAKGLEWNTVFIMNLSSGAFPGERALKEHNGLEEERRLFYVAITRAKERLFLTYPMAGGSYGDFLSGPSMFLGEINPDLIEDRSLLSFNSSVLNDGDVTYEPEDDVPFKSKPKIKPGSFLRSLDDL